jgi:hypothetical protein
MVHNMPQTLPPDQQRSFQDSDGVFLETGHKRGD